MEPKDNSIPDQKPQLAEKRQRNWRERISRSAAYVGSILALAGGSAEAASAKPQADKQVNVAASIANHKVVAAEKSYWTIESLQAQMQKELDGQVNRFFTLRAGGNKKMGHWVDNTYRGRPGANEEELYQFSVPTGKTAKLVIGGKASEAKTYDIYDAFFTKGPHSPRELLGLEITLGGYLSLPSLENPEADGAQWHTVVLPNDFNVDNYYIYSNLIHNPSGNPAEAENVGTSYGFNLKTGGQSVAHQSPTTDAPESGTPVSASLDSVYQGLEGFISASNDFIDKYGG